MFKKGSVVYRQYQLQEPASAKSEGGEEQLLTSQLSRTQQEKVRKLQRKAQVVVEHVDIIKDDFWERRPWILSGKPGKIPAA